MQENLKNEWYLMIESHKFFPKLCKDQTLECRFRCLVEIVKYDSCHSGREKWCNCSQYSRLCI